MQLERKSAVLLFLLLFVRNPSGLSLAVLHLLQVESDAAVSEGVGVGGSAVFLEGGSEASDESVEAAPRLLQRAGAGPRWLRLPEEDAAMQVNLCLSELVEVPEELDHVLVATLAHRNRRPLVCQVLPEGVPVPFLLRLVPAEDRRRRLAAA